MAILQILDAPKTMHDRDLIKEILNFWIKDVGPKKWFRSSKALDDEIRSRFQDHWRAAADGAYDEWASTPDGACALIILLDQFPRNMFRGTSDAFASDAKALEIAKVAVETRRDLEMPQAVRQLFYLPFMHAEDLSAQERCIDLIRERSGDSTNLHHAEQHSDLIRQFGRFPHRNEVLGRESTEAEKVYLETSSGFGQTS